jgi:2',3'-cyclic-nucleotide 2'-phosphodiesterase (5'-nucleotidase family)
MARRASLRTGFFLALASVWTGTILAGASCSGTGEGGTTPTPTSSEPEHVAAPELGAPDLRLVVITDLEGYLEPCGCTSRPLGGIDRMAAEVARLRSEGAPTVLVASGDLLFNAGGDHHVHRPGAETQEIWKAETLLDVLGHMQLAGAVPGGLDLRFGASTFATLAESAPFPLLAAGVSVSVPSSDVDAGAAATSDAGASTRTLSLRDRTIVEAGGLRVGLLGLTDMAVAGRADPAVTAPEDLVARAEESASALRSDGADVVIALVRAPRRTTRRIATQVSAIDFVIEGGLDEAEAHLPATTENGVIVHAGRQGQHLVVVDVHRRDAAAEPASDAAPWTDVGTWAREAERARLVAQATELRARIAEWERDPSTAQADLAEQRTRLGELEAEARALVAVPEAPRGAFTATLVELDPDRPREAGVTEILAAYDRRVNEHNREAFADWTPTPAAEGQPSYVGSEVCGSCHAEEIAWWRTTMHGRAYATLVDRHKEYNLSCVGCHVTGYNRPGGSTVSHTGPLQNVGCESCHGPGSQHVVSPTGAAVNVTRDAEEGRCLGCHTPEHSDRFVYTGYRAMMMVPGHGLPSP